MRRGAKLGEILRRITLRVGAVRSLEPWRLADVELRALVHHRNLHRGQGLVRGERLDVRREREHRLHPRILPARPRAPESEHGVAAERVPCGADCIGVDPSREHRVRQQRIDQVFEIVASIDVGLIGPRKWIAQRLLRTQVAEAPARVVDRAEGRVVMVGCSHDVPVTRELLREEQRLRAAATQPVREHDQRQRTACRRCVLGHKPGETVAVGVTRRGGESRIPERYPESCDRGDRIADRIWIAAGALRSGCARKG